MASPGASPEKKKATRYGAAGLLMAIPTMLLAGPLVGYFIGNWADKKLATEPYLTIVGLVLGFVAAGRQIYFLIRKVQRLEEESEG